MNGTVSIVFPFFFVFFSFFSFLVCASKEKALSIKTKLNAI